MLGDPYWGTPDGKAPPAIPVCGFNNEFCPPDQTGIPTTLCMAWIIEVYSI